MQGELASGKVSYTQTRRAAEHPANIEVTRKLPKRKRDDDDDEVCAITFHLLRTVLTCCRNGAWSKKCSRGSCRRSTKGKMLEN